MINRVLIRIKVVQLLYSYFLVQNNFAVEAPPTAPTREKRFAYTLYLDYLYLMVEIARRVSPQGTNSALYKTRFIQRLLEENIINTLRNKYSNETFQLEGCIDDLAERIKNSEIYKKFQKTPDADNKIWPEIFANFISTDPRIASLAVGYENYSLRGMDRAKEMTGETFTKFASSQDNMADGLADLRASLDKARELYFRLLLLPMELTYQQEVELDEKRHRYVKNDEDMHPNPKFIDNELVKLLNNNETIREYVEKHKISWVEQDRDLIRHLLKRLTESELYQDYMSTAETDLHEDCEFWKKAMHDIILPDPEFLEVLETKSVFWNDDLEIMSEFVIKTFRNFEAYTEEGTNRNPVFPMYKDDEDAKFGAELFEDAVRNRALYKGYIEEALNRQHWESDRLAYMDVVIMETALAEILNFPKIPIQASMNEYIEIAKSYSSPKSGTFVNGLLATVITNLKETGKLRK